jgi:hypothetical protein
MLMPASLAEIQMLGRLIPTLEQKSQFASSMQYHRLSVFEQDWEAGIDKAHEGHSTVRWLSTLGFQESSTISAFGLTRNIVDFSVWCCLVPICVIT